MTLILAFSAVGFLAGLVIGQRRQWRFDRTIIDGYRRMLKL